jgi:ubiquinone biosynthesis protein UbiJ
MERMNPMRMMGPMWVYGGESEMDQFAATLSDLGEELRRLNDNLEGASGPDAGAAATADGDEVSDSLARVEERLERMESGDETAEALDAVRADLADIRERLERIEAEVD